MIHNREDQYSHDGKLGECDLPWNNVNKPKDEALGKSGKTYKACKESTMLIPGINRSYSIVKKI